MKPGPSQFCGKPATSLPNGFTLVELLVAIAVLMLMMVLISQLFNSASAVTGMGTKRMDADTQARAVFDRMAIDFAQMVKRTDVDYFLKSRQADQSGNSQPQDGSGPGDSNTHNDRLAFYSQVPGFFPAGTSATNQSPVSLVAYRVNADTASPYYNKLQRYGCGLVWNGVAGTNTAVVFSPGTNGSASASGTNNAIYNNWKNTTDNQVADSNYELAGPQVFRMEYYYVLKGQTVAGTFYPSILSDTPWDFRIPSHTSVNGLQDVASIAVVMAVADPKTRVLVNDSQLAQLAAKMNDFSTAATPNPGDLETQWRSAVDSASIPRIATSAIRIYGRTFYLPSRP